MIDIIQAIHDPHLLKPLFRNLDTWAAWQVFLRTLFGLPLPQADLKLYRASTGRETPPRQPFQEAWCPTGVRSGKSFIAALVAVYLAAFRDYREHLAPGERAMILIIAADRAQAQVIFRYIKAALSANKMLKKLVETERQENIDLRGMVTIQVATCSYRSIRGFTAAAVICDEVAFWRSETDSANPANEVLRAVRPRLATIPGSLLLCIGSPWARSGPVWEAYNRHYGKDESDVLVWRADTRTMNPTFRQALIDREMLEDPEMARTEYFAEFRTDLESYLSQEAVEGCLVQGRAEMPPLLGLKYSAFVDPSGGRRDAATLAIAHKDRDRVVLDLARRWKAPHDPAQVVREMAALLAVYQLRRVTGDRYAGAWPTMEFQKHGIIYEASAQDKSGLYLDFAPMVLSGKVELLDIKHLKMELIGLERRARSGGRDTVDHPPRGTDDLANSVAGVCARLGTTTPRCDAIRRIMI